MEDRVGGRRSAPASAPSSGRGRRGRRRRGRRPRAARRSRRRRSARHRLAMPPLVEQLERAGARPSARPAPRPSATGWSGSPSTRVADPLAAVGQADEAVGRTSRRRRGAAQTPTGRVAARARAPATRRARRSARAAPSRSVSRRRGLGGVGSSPARASSASAPWPGAGVISSRPKRKAISSSRPSRRRPAAARTIPSSSPSRELAQPGVDVAAQLDDLEVGAQRRAAASGGAGSRSRPGRPRGPRRASRPSPTQASAGSSRAGTPTSASPSGSSPGRSLARVDAEVDLAVEQRPLDLADEARLVAGRSAALVAGGPDRDQLGAAERARRPASAWASARALPRVPIRKRSPSALSLAARVGARAQLRSPRRRCPRARSPASRPNSSRSARDLQVGVVLLGGALQPQRRLVQDPARDRARHRLDPLAVGLAEALPAALVLGQDAARRSRRRGSRSAATVGTTSSEPSQRSKRASSASRMRSARARLGLAAGGVALGDRLHVVDVVDG